MIKALPPPNSSSESDTQSKPLPKMTYEEIQALRRKTLALQQTAKAKAATTKPTKGQQQANVQSKAGWLFGGPTQTVKQAKTGAGKPKGKTLIHVPPPIMEYFDVKNDHFMMK
jgi:uncharacterized membrane protein